MNYLQELLDQVRTALPTWSPLLALAGSVIVAVITAFWAFFQYIATRRLQARQPFLSKQLEVYFTAAKVVGNFAFLKLDSEEWRKNEDSFWELYWAELSIVESPGVEKAMVEVGKALNTYKASPDDEHRNTLNGYIYLLARAIRESIKSGWRGRV